MIHRRSRGNISASCVRHDGVAARWSWFLVRATASAVPPTTWMGASSRRFADALGVWARLGPWLLAWGGTPSGSRWRSRHERAGRPACGRCIGGQAMAPARFRATTANPDAPVNCHAARDGSETEALKLLTPPVQASAGWRSAPAAPTPPCRPCPDPRVRSTRPPSSRCAVLSADPYAQQEGLRICSARKVATASPRARAWSPHAVLRGPTSPDRRELAAGSADAAGIFATNAETGLIGMGQRHAPCSAKPYLVLRAQDRKMT